MRVISSILEQRVISRVSLSLAPPLWKEILSTGNGFTDAAYGLGKIAVIDQSSNVYVSSDLGSSWVTYDLSAISATLGTILFANGKFVIAPTLDGGGGSSSNMIYSSDGVTWLPQDSFSPLPYDFSDITYGLGLYVAVAPQSSSFGGNSKAITTSPDGANWLARTISNLYPWHRVCFGAGVFIALSTDNRCMRSVDGINWTITSNAICENGASSGFSKIVFDGTYFCVCAYGENSFFKIDPATGLRVGASVPQLPLSSLSITNSLCLYNGNFYANCEINLLNGDGMITKSSDGITFEPYEFPALDQQLLLRQFDTFLLAGGFNTGPLGKLFIRQTI